MNLVKKISLLALVASFTVACGDGKKDDAAAEGTAVDSTAVVADTMAVEQPTTIVDVAAGNENFTTLVAAVKAAGLVETLSSEGPFTVFAPTNDAFASLLIELNLSGLADVPQATLENVLKYHVVAGANVLSNAIPTTPITTLESGTITIAGTVITDESNRQSNIVLTDVQCSNGVVHAIDKVLLPTL